MKCVGATGDTFTFRNKYEGRFLLFIMPTDCVFMRFVAMVLPAQTHLKQISLSLGVQEQSFYAVCLFTKFIIFIVFLEGHLARGERRNTLTSAFCFVVKAHE